MRARSGKKLALVLAVLLVLACLAPYLACAAHRSHGCPGSACCLVCRALEESMLQLRLFAPAMAVLCAILAQRRRGFSCVCAALPQLFARTPVARKVRLND